MKIGGLKVVFFFLPKDHLTFRIGITFEILKVSSNFQNMPNRPIFMKLFIRTTFLVFLFLCTATAFSQKVISINVKEGINPASAEFIQQSIKTAEKEKAQCLVINLNTPGGLLTSTREIVADIMSSKVPVVVYISPTGARAGSAGVFITMASHIAAMAPGTNIGAAHPVSMQGKADGIMNEKTTNDASAFIRSIAEKRNRNVAWAEEAVRTSASISETEALEQNVVNLVADNENDLLQKINGLTVQTSSGTVRLNTAGAQVENVEMGFFLKVLSRISDPNIAYILMMLGFFGLIFELFNPGAIFPGIVGVICLILAFYTMSSLPVNYAAIALIIFGIILYLLEIKITSHGMLAIGGTISVFLGSMFLFRTSSTDEVASLSWAVIITTTLVTFLFFVFLVGMGLKAQKLKPAMGKSSMIGKKGIALTQVGESGTVRVMGETWKAIANEGIIPANAHIYITAIKGLTLYVSADAETETNTSNI